MTAMTEQRKIDEAYGALRANIHTTIYSFESATKNLIWLLKEDRWKQCGTGFKTVDAFIQSTRMEDHKLVAESRKQIAILIKAAQPKISNRKIGKALGASSKTIDRDFATNVAKPSENTIKNNQDIATDVAISGREAWKAAERAANKVTSHAAAEERREQSRTAEPLPGGCVLRIGDCRKVLTDVPDNSVPLILTDPPYEAESEPLYEWLGAFAKRVLIPGGSLICYTGHWSLNRDTRIFDQHLRYWWLLVMLHDQSRRLPGKFVIANFKPVLWYVKDFRRGRTLMPDLLQSPARDKELHNWGQGEGGVSQIIEHLTSPGEMILDPFAGTAQWGRIAANMGRQWLGSDLVEGGTTTIVADEPHPDETTHSTWRVTQ